MNRKSIAAFMAIALLLVPSCLLASTVLEEQGIIRDFDVEVYSFEADIAPFTYAANLFDLSNTLTGLFPGSALGFESIGLAILDGSGNVVASRGDFGSVSFEVSQGAKYFAWVVGETDDSGIGAFGLNIEAVPIPSALLLLGTGLVGLIAIRRRGR